MGSGDAGSSLRSEPVAALLTARAQVIEVRAVRVNLRTDKVQQVKPRLAFAAEG